MSIFRVIEKIPARENKLVTNIIGIYQYQNRRAKTTEMTKAQF